MIYSNCSKCGVRIMTRSRTPRLHCQRCSSTQVEQVRTSIQGPDQRSADSRSAA